MWLEHAFRGNRFPWFVTLLMLTACLVFQSMNHLTADSGWLLIASERMLEGEKLYEDIWETNPPLIMWLLAVPVWIKNGLGLPVIPVFIVCNGLLACWSLWHVWRVLGRSLYTLRGERCLLFAVNSLVLLWCSQMVFGQREWIMLVLLAPWFMASLDPRPCPRPLLAIAAAIGLCLKPYFLLIWMASELVAAFRPLRPSRLWRADNLIIAAVALLYAISIWWFTPAYITRIVPLMISAYDAFNYPMSRIFLSSCWIMALFLVTALLPGENTRNYYQALGAFLGAYASYLLQHKGWYYHFYPVLYFGLLMMALQAIRLVKSKRRIAMPLGLSLGMVAVFFMLLQPYEHWAGKGADTLPTQLGPLIEKHGKNKELYNLSYSVAAPFPAVNVHGMPYHSSFPCQCLLYAAVKGLPVNADLTNVIVADFQKLRPAMVLTDNKPYLVEYLERDARFRKIWRSYKRVTTLTDPYIANPPVTFDVFVKTP